MEWIIIPNSVTAIGAGAFDSCGSLVDIVIPDKVASIGDYAFWGCGITSIIIPNSVTTIGEYVFEGCENLVIKGGKGSYSENYAQENNIQFEVYEEEKTDLSSASVTLSQNSYTCDGTAKTPEVTVKIGETILVRDRDYTVSYSNNINVGTAIVTVTGTGSYIGSKTATFTIVSAAAVRAVQQEAQAAVLRVDQSVAAALRQVVVALQQAAVRVAETV